MNIIDIRNGSGSISQTKSTSIVNYIVEVINYLLEVIPNKIESNSSEIVKSMHNLVWEYRIPIYLINGIQMPDKYYLRINDKKYKDNYMPPTEYLGYYNKINYENKQYKAIYLCIDRIKDNKKLLAKVLLHELGHALLEANVEDYGYRFDSNNLIKFMEESLANFILLKYLNEIRNTELFNYCREYIYNQGFGYNYGVCWYDNNLEDYNSWIEMKRFFANTNYINYEELKIYKNRYVGFNKINMDFYWEYKIDLDYEMRINKRISPS